MKLGYQSPLMGLFLLASLPVLAQPCSCPFPEQEPNDLYVVYPPPLTISFGQSTCGTISSPVDVDYAGLDLAGNTKFRMVLMDGTDVPPECGQGLNTMVDILAADGELVARCGDQNSQSSVYESDFRIGPGIYALKIYGANETVGHYQILFDAGSTMPPPEPELTIIKGGGQSIILRWQYEDYLPGEEIQIERTSDLSVPFLPVLTVDATSFQVIIIDFPQLQDISFFRAVAIGERPGNVTDPLPGSLLTLSTEEELSGDPIEADDVMIDEIEFAVNDDDEVVISKLLAHDPDNPSQQIVQDNTDAYGDELTPIDDFSGHVMDIWGRTVTVSHLTLGQDPISGGIGVVDGRGTDVNTLETVLFGDLPRCIQGDDEDFLAFCFGFDEPDICCRIKTIAFCGPFGIRPPPAGMPCPCPYAPNQATCPPGPPCQPCNSCTLRVDMTGTLRRCICSFDPAPFGQPPAQIFCTFKPRFKCKYYPCLNGTCQGAPPCPFNQWQVGNPTPFGRATCKHFCM